MKKAKIAFEVDMQATSRHPKALVVEDQELFREAVADELEFLGFRTLKAVDGEEALRMILEEHIDLILSDMRMPNKDGRWLLNETRKLSKVSPPFIFMSGFTDLCPRDAYDMGADAFIGKPLNTERLHGLIRKFCQLPQERWNAPPLEMPSVSIKQVYPCSPTSAACEAAVGRGGLMLVLETSTMKVGEKVAFDLRFQEGALSRLEGTGTVVWRNDESYERTQVSYGIDFDYIHADCLPALLELLTRLDNLSVIPKGNLKV
jgi:DNA-binding response OmpR family regulator